MRSVALKGLKAARLAKGYSQREVGDALGVEQPTIQRWEAGKRSPSVEEVDALSRLLGVTADALFGRTNEVPVVGKVGAGGSVLFEDAYPLDEGFDRVIRPPDAMGDLIGLEIAGDSMWPKFLDGEIVYISRDRDGVDADYVGSFVVAKLATGEVYLKQLARGSAPGRYTLRSLNAPDMEDVAVDWATPVRGTLSRWGRRLS